MRKYRNHRACHTTPVIPDTPPVIPDVSNRESKTAGAINHRTDTTPVIPGTAPVIPGTAPSFPIPPLSFPTLVIGNPWPSAPSVTGPVPPQDIFDNDVHRGDDRENNHRPEENPESQRHGHRNDKPSLERRLQHHRG